MARRAWHFAALVALVAPTALLAQTQPRISVPPLATVEPASEAPIEIEIGPADAVPARSFVRIRGLPPTIGLSEGYAIAPGSWAVPIAGLKALRLIVPAGLATRAELTVSLVALDGQILATGTSLLVVAPRTTAEPSPPPASGPARASTFVAPAATPAPAAPSARQDQKREAALQPPTQPALPPSASLSDPDRQRLTRQLQLGNNQLSEGNVAAARLFFQRAADGGLAEAALAMGGTYDAVELARQRVVGMPADPAEARRWYERARELGAKEAVGRLERLGQR